MANAPPLEHLHQIRQTCLEGRAHRMTLHDIAYHHGSRLLPLRRLHVAEGRTFTSPRAERISPINIAAVKGLAMKMVAPAASAARRVSTEACPVTTMTGDGFAMARAARTTSRPSPSGRRRSEMTSRGWSRVSAINPADRVVATITSYPCRRSNRSYVARKSGSFSTTSTSWSHGDASMSRPSHGQNRARRDGQYPTRHAAKNELCEAGAPVGAHDHHIGLLRASGLGDALVLHAFQQQAFHPGSHLPGFPDELVQLLLAIGARRGFQVLVDARGYVPVGHDGNDGGDDVHEQQLRRVGLRHVDGPPERGRRGSGEIGGMHDASDLLHRSTSLSVSGVDCRPVATEVPREMSSRIGTCERDCSGSVGRPLPAGAGAPRCGYPLRSYLLIRRWKVLRSMPAAFAADDTLP